MALLEARFNNASATGAKACKYAYLYTVPCYRLFISDAKYVTVRRSNSLCGRALFVIPVTEYYECVLVCIIIRRSTFRHDLGYRCNFL